MIEETEKFLDKLKMSISSLFCFFCGENVLVEHTHLFVLKANGHLATVICCKECGEEEREEI